MKHKTRSHIPAVFLSKSLSVILSLSLLLPSPALALRGQSPKEAGLEEKLVQALKAPVQAARRLVQSVTGTPASSAPPGNVTSVILPEISGLEERIKRVKIQDARIAIVHGDSVNRKFLSGLVQEQLSEYIRQREFKPKTQIGLFSSVYEATPWVQEHHPQLVIMELDVSRRPGIYEYTFEVGVEAKAARKNNAETLVILFANSTEFRGDEESEVNNLLIRGLIDALIPTSETDTLKEVVQKMFIARITGLEEKWKVVPSPEHPFPRRFTTKVQAEVDELVILAVKPGTPGARKLSDLASKLSPLENTVFPDLLPPEERALSDRIQILARDYSRRGVDAEEENADQLYLLLGILRYIENASLVPVAGLEESAVLEIRPDIAEEYKDLFGTQRVNGREVNVEGLIADLTRRFGADFSSLLAARAQFRRQVAEGKAQYGFADPETMVEDADGNRLAVKQVRAGMLANFLGQESPAAWNLRPAPPETLKPGLQGTGPIDDLGMGMGAINTGAYGATSWMFDWEDAGNDWQDKLYRAWRFLKQLLYGQWNDGVPYAHPTKKKEYKINIPRGQWPVIFHRVPGLHLRSRQINLEGRPVPAIIPALIMHAVHNYDSLRRDSSGVYFYIPKIETPEEALLVAKLLKTLEEALGLSRGTIRIEMLHERIRYSANQESIMWVLRDWLIGPNVGRWDYINSRIEMGWHDRESVFPDPHTV